MVLMMTTIIVTEISRIAALQRRLYCGSFRTLTLTLAGFEKKMRKFKIICTTHLLPSHKPLIKYTIKISPVVRPLLIG